jgi:hypothetical protein
VPEPLDQEAYQRRLDRLTEMFGSMMETVEDLTTKRCPYKDRHGRCTAQFGCRNQRKPPEEDRSGAGQARPLAQGGKRFICGGDDKLDYRSAWEVP